MNALVEHKKSWELERAKKIINLKSLTWSELQIACIRLWASCQAQYKSSYEYIHKPTCIEVISDAQYKILLHMRGNQTILFYSS